MRVIPLVRFTSTHDRTGRVLMTTILQHGRLPPGIVIHEGHCSRDGT